MKIPIATYRVQLNDKFGFDQLKELLPYLNKLGISHVYASPIFQARETSTHGYDIVDQNRISRQLGGFDTFEKACRECAVYGIGWIQDIVPNHVAYSMENELIKDVLQKGVKSKFHGFFDVDWNHPSRLLKGKIMAPFLEKSYKECLYNGEFKLVYNTVGLALRYKETEFPLKKETCRGILGEKNDFSEETVEKTLNKYNSDPALLDKLISKQNFGLTYWKTALRRINYRRFFDIMDLICLNMERPQVLESTHRLIFDLLANGKFGGVRVDHIDGLYDPERYIDKIREKSPDTFVVVEKILTGDEKLSRHWRVQGTTGYDFLNKLNNLFVDIEKETEFDAIYKQFTREKDGFSQLLYKCKKHVIRKYFGGDVDNLSHLVLRTLQNTSGADRNNDKKTEKKDRTVRAYQKAIYLSLVELFACFPVYRTYLTENDTSIQTQKQFQAAISLAIKKKPNMQTELEAISDLLRETPVSGEALATVMRLQQFTGVFMAKGFEDTALYRYNRLLSLNDVGSDPTEFGCTIQEFHEFNLTKLKNWPLSLNTTSTHDTKRGEDIRARLNVLSEIPAEFKNNIEKWTRLNTRLKDKIKGKSVPDRNEEWYIYQTLLGAYPFNQEEVEMFVKRIKIHIVKMLREAKIHSNWLSPNLRHENAVTQFAEKILDPENEEFLVEFIPFQKKVAQYGILNSLGQTLIKITSPGIPDFYQGSDLWDLNLVDPDNRRSVDFQKRQNLLDEVSKADETKINEILETPEDGKCKLYEIYKALQARKKRRILFEEGAYIPLETKGIFGRQVVAFCRKRGEKFALVVVPRFFTGLTGFKECMTGFDWKNTQVCLPEDAPKIWRNIFTGDPMISKHIEKGMGLPVSEVLCSFPVALLFSGEAK